MKQLNYDNLMPRLTAAWTEWKELDLEQGYKDWLADTYGVGYTHTNVRITSAWVENERKHLMFLIKFGEVVQS